MDPGATLVWSGEGWDEFRMNMKSAIAKANEELGLDSTGTMAQQVDVL